MIRLTGPTRALSCQLCGQRPLARFDVAGSSRLWHCAICELYQFGQFVGAEAYGQGYHQGYERRRSHKIRTAQVRLGRIAAALKSTRPDFLEVGCSVGCTIEAAAGLGWRATGVDISVDAIEACRARGLNCQHVEPCQLPFGDESFDVVASWHVIEHVADVRLSLWEWNRVLRPGGLLALETPDASCPKVRRLGNRYRKFWAPEHTYTFTPSNLGCFVEECGFEVIRQPVIGDWMRMHPSVALYATVYQSYHGLRRLAGIEKAFQLFARKVQAIPHSEVADVSDRAGRSLQMA